MSTSQKPVAIRLADKYEVHGFLSDHRYAKDQWCMQAVAELRRQHARIAELEEMLRREVQHSAGLRVAPIATSPEAKSGTYRCQAPQGYVRPQEPDSHDGHDYEGFIGGCQRMGCEAPEAAADMGIPMSESDAPAVLPEPAAWLATFRSEGMLSSHSVAGTDLEELKRSVPSGSKFKPLYAQPAYYRNALPPYGVVTAEEHWAETEHAKHYGLEHLVPRREPFEFEKDERGAQQ